MGLENLHTEVDDSQPMDEMRDDNAHLSPKKPVRNRRPSLPHDDFEDAARLAQVSRQIEQQGMANAVDKIDGEQVFREASNGLPAVDAEVLEAGLKGPPPVERKHLGTALSKVAARIPELTDFQKRNNPQSFHFILDAVAKNAATPSFGLRCWIRKCMKDAEGVASNSTFTQDEETFGKQWKERCDQSLTQEEKQAKETLRENMNQYCREGKKQGKKFLSERERKETASGGGYVIEWMMERVNTEIGFYKDIEKLSKEEASPVVLQFKKSEKTEQPKPTLVITPKKGGDAKAFMELIGKDIDADQIHKNGEKWEIQEISSIDVEKVLKRLKTVVSGQK